MNKYLEKIAEDLRGPDTFSKAGIGGAGSAAGTIAGGALSMSLGNSLIRDMGRESIDPDTVDLRGIRKILKNEDLKVTFSRHKAFGKGEGLEYTHGAGPLFVSKDGLKKGTRYSGFVSGRNLEGRTVKDLNLLVHELGHAKAFGKGFGSARNKAYMASKMLSLTGTSGVIGAAMLTNDATADHAVLAPLVAAAPMLAEEAAANYYGHKMLRKHVSAKAANNFLKMVPKQLSNYAAMPAGIALGIYGAKKLLNHMKENNLE